MCMQQVGFCLADQFVEIVSLIMAWMQSTMYLAASVQSLILRVEALEQDREILVTAVLSLMYEQERVAGARGAGRTRAAGSRGAERTLEHVRALQQIISVERQTWSDSMLPMRNHSDALRQNNDGGDDSWSTDSEGRRGPHRDAAWRGSHRDRSRSRCRSAPRGSARPSIVVNYNSLGGDIHQSWRRQQ